ncbi:MAG: hypothetical protein GY750_17175 [Lentisphaerae bacterium]|nr:hypothetical protein [Lentisphaerota bacterium]MCP4103130.1 hypothetical protein [Lentisphaerota bacterium]
MFTSLKNKYLLNYYYELIKATTGDVKAQTKIASWTYYGTCNGLRNKKLSLEWYKIAASNNDVESTYIVGKILYFDKGNLNDRSEGIKYIKRAALKNNVEANSAMGYILENKENLSAAFKYFMKAAKAGDLDSEYKVAFYYLLGLGVKKNITKAKEWAQKAAEKKSISSQNLLVNILLEAENKLDSAEQLINNILKQKPRNSIYIDTYGTVLLKQKKYNDALEKFLLKIHL